MIQACSVIVPSNKLAVEDTDTVATDTNNSTRPCRTSDICHNEDRFLLHEIRQEMESRQKDDYNHKLYQ